MREATVLVVEDHQQLRGVVTQALELEGYTVLAARDGAEGLQLARTHAPDLVLLDIMLPAVDGFEVLEQISKGNVATRVIMMTAHTFTIRRIVACIKSGACDYVTKPFSLDALLDAVRRALALESTINVRMANDATPIIQSLQVKAAELERENETLRERVRALSRRSHERWREFFVKLACLAAAIAVTLGLVALNLVTNPLNVVLLFGAIFFLLLFPTDRLTSFTARHRDTEATAQIAPPD